jgi:hypothetical protein
MSKFFQEINYLPELKINKPNTANPFKIILLEAIDLFIKDRPQHRQILESSILKNSRKIVQFMEKSDFRDLEDEEHYDMNMLFSFYLCFLVAEPIRSWSDNILSHATVQLFRYGGQDIFRFILRLVDEPRRKILSAYFDHWEELILEDINQNCKNKLAKLMLSLGSHKSHDEDD